MAKYLFLDLETTGLDPKKNGIIQMAGIVEVEGEEVKRFNWHVKPFEGDVVDQRALDVNGKTVDDINQYPEASKVFGRFKAEVLEMYVNKFNKCDKFFIVGYNVNFDENFLRQWFKKMDDKFFGSYFWWPSIDVAGIAALKYRNTRGQFTSFKLENVARTLGVDMGDKALHDAAYDIDITRKLYRILMEGQRDVK